MTSDLSPSVATPALEPVDLRQLSWPSRLVCDYCHDFDRLRPFFLGSPADPATWREALRARRERSGAGREIANVLGQQLAARDAPAPARHEAARLAESSTVCIVTGQQAGLFGGPVYTLLKAVTAIALARRVASEYEIAAVPVFWVDAEDHDLAEISRTAVLSDDLSLRQVSVASMSGPNRPAATVRMASDIIEALDELESFLPATGFSASLLDRLRSAYRPDVGVVDAFCRWLDDVLGRHGLVVFDASDPSAKPLVRSIFEREVATRGESSRLAAAAGARLLELGYHAQVTPAADAVSLFRLNGERQPIRLPSSGDQAFTVGGETIPSAELESQVHAHPESFSPNVLLRPVVQDTLFPSVAYVAGPSELAYLAQLRSVYEHFDVPMPIVYPRVTATLVDRATVKFLRRYDVAFSELRAQDDTVLNHLLSALLPESIERTLSGITEHLDEQLTGLATAVSTVDPTLSGPVDTTRHRMHKDLGSLRNKIIQAAKRRDDTLRRQFHRARALSFPDGAPQERAIGFVYVLNRYGPQVIDYLLAELPLDIGRHWVLTI